MSLHLPLAALLAATGIAAATPLPLPPAPEESEVIELERERYDRLTVPVTIGGKGPYMFMIDTGAQATLVSRQLADELGLNDRQSANLIGMASSMQVETAIIPDFELGSRSFEIQSAPLVDAQHLSGSHGVLGVDSLQNQRVLIDFANRRIAVADARQLGGNNGYEIVVRARQKLGQLILTRAELDGVRTSVIVDTGAQGSIGNHALLDRLRRAEHVGENLLTDINGVEKSGTVKIGGTLSFGQANVTNLPILFVESPVFEALGLSDKPALILGMEELRLFQRVAIDFEQQKVLFDLPRSASLKGSGPSGRTRNF